MSPGLKISISGFEPLANMAWAMIRVLRRVFITTWSPEFMVLRSRVQISGFSARMCGTRSNGGSRVVPGPATFGSSGSGT